MSQSRKFWDAVIKVGGSLHNSPTLRDLLDVLAERASVEHLLVIPGGGPFADAVHRSFRRLRLSEKGAHRMALLAMDQYGLLLSDLEPRAVAVHTLTRAQQVARAGKLPILLAARAVPSAKELPPSWSVTSDSVAAWIAVRTGARRLILLKSVPIPSGTSAVTAKELIEAGVLDRAFAGVSRRTAEVWVTSGRRPEMVGSLLAGDPQAGTRVESRRSAPRRGRSQWSRRPQAGRLA